MRNALLQESTGSGEQTAERRFQRVGVGGFIREDGQREQNVARQRRARLALAVFPILADSFQWIWRTGSPG